MSFYENTLSFLTATVLSLFAIQKCTSATRKTSPAGSVPSARRAYVATLTRQYLVVYALVMAADWLQGPYLWSLYHEHHGERAISTLFVCGFVSGGLTAPLIGVFADQHGRKKMCLLFCITYALSCATVLYPAYPSLLVGRILGGFSTSILFGVFESWLVSESTSKGLGPEELSSIMASAQTLNGFVATGAGVASNILFSLTGSYASPFVASGSLLVLAWAVIQVMWGENYGQGGGESASSNSKGDPFQLKRMGDAWRVVKADPLLLILGLTQTCFEGSMYLFVFLWAPSLEEVSSTKDLPLGRIFSSLMLCMMLGSMLYSGIVSISISTTRESSLVLHSRLSSAVSAASAIALSASALSDDERVRFVAFGAFEVSSGVEPSESMLNDQPACVGMYFPVQGMLRGSLIPNEHRATLSSLFRVPLNIFVIIALLTGVSSARYAVLIASSGMLAFSSIMTAVVVGPRVSLKNHKQ